MDKGLGPYGNRDHDYRDAMSESTGIELAEREKERKREKGRERERESAMSETTGVEPAERKKEREREREKVLLLERVLCQRALG